MSQALSELDRRLSDLLRYGTVASYSDGLVTVTLDDNTTTAPLPWFAARAGKNRKWDPPDLGEQVMILSPSGELARGTVLPAIFQDAFPENGDSQDLDRKTYEDGTVVEYNRDTHAMLVDASASNGSLTVNTGSGPVVINCSTATVNATDSVTLDTPQATITGHLTVQGGMDLEGGAGGTMQITGDVNITGSVLTHNGKNISSTHTHGGVQTGGGNTGAPN